MKTVLFLLLVSAFSWGNELQIKVVLNPAGSFVAKSSEIKVEGELKRAGSGFGARKIVVPISSLKTGIELRDSHMKKKYFESEKFPSATLIEAQGQGGKFQGKLEVHGTVHPVSGIYKIDGAQLEAEFSCKLSDFKIPEANYMGVGVEDEVSVIVKLGLK